jgi:trimeric autotransporter adhesin
VSGNNNGAIGAHSVFGATEITNLATSANSGFTVGGATPTLAGNTASQGTSFGTAASPTRLVNVAAGRINATSTDAVNGSELFAVNAAVTGVSTSVAGMSTSLSGVSSSVTAVSTSLTAVSSSLTAVSSSVTGVSTSLSSLNSNFVAAGLNNGQPANGAVFGFGSSAGPGGTALGNGAHAGSDSVAVGTNAFAAGPHDTAVGYHASVGAENGTALGSGATVTPAAVNAVAIGANSVATEPNTVSFGSVGNERRLTNVAPGVAGTDAVNLNQLNAFANATGRQFVALRRQDRSDTSIALASGGIRWDDRPGRISVGGAVSNFGDQVGLAFGLGATSPGGSWRYSVTGSFSPTYGNNAGVVGAATFSFGGP